jgi:hypothetical protein
LQGAHGPASVVQPIPHDDDIVFPHGAEMVFDFVAQFPGFKNYYFQVVRPVQGYFMPAFNDQKAHVHRVRIPKRPHVVLLLSDLPVYKGVGTLPL